ncbi:MAG: hypothetical protein ACYC8T_18350 [Myxococcaceae bacterium]
MTSLASRAAQLACAIIVTAVLGLSSSALAVPIFARKYQASCQTCHVAFPKLTPFGDAFRRNGYRYPGGEEEDSAKEAPLELGQQAHKRVFPSAVWPGEIPSAPVASVRIGSQVNFGPTATSKVSFAGVGENIGLNFAANLGDAFAGWAGAVMRAAQGPKGESVQVEMERIFMVVSPFEKPVATVKVGRFEPGIFSFTLHRMLGAAPWITTSTVGDDRFSLDPAQLGLEASGVLGSGRVSYAAGVVDGSGNLLNSAKDLYGRAGVKLGGMRLDGVGGATESDPWREKSVQVGAFGYLGQSTLGDRALATQEDHFWLAGGDVNVLFGDANLMVAYSNGVFRRPLLADPGRSMRSWQLFSQLDYVLYPWLIPTARYEHQSVGGVASDRISGGAYVLARAHVRFQALATVEGRAGTLQLSGITFGLNMAF